MVVLTGQIKLKVYNYEYSVINYTTNDVLCFNMLVMTSEELEWAQLLCNNFMMLLWILHNWPSLYVKEQLQQRTRRLFLCLMEETSDLKH